MHQRVEVRIAAGAMLLGAMAGVAGAGCASESKTPLVLDGAWQRIDVWEQRSSFDYDQVATGASPDAVGWLSRDAGDAARLEYWEIRDGAEATGMPLPTPTAPVIIPVGVATDDDGWAAAAVTRDRPKGANTGLLAWRGHTRDQKAAPAQSLAPPTGTSAAPESVSVARSADHLAVAALYDGTPVVWSGLDTATGGWAGGTDAWRSPADPIDLGLDASLRSLRIVGDGTHLVLAGVDGQGAAHLWTSDDGATWSSVDAPRLPKKVGAVGLLTPLARGKVAVGWLGDEQSAPFNATSATIQRLSGTTLADDGALEATPDAGIDRLHLTSATLSPEHKLVVVGGAVRSSGARTPMVWLRDGGEWHPTKQAALNGHLDHEFRAVVTTRDNDAMVAIATALTHPDVEAWQWRP
jgi:hypothetical protein